MTCAGIIFSNMYDRDLAELTRVRTMASVPFACRYRLIDFPLSNMVNADIGNVFVITQYNYHSLMDHLGSGKDWDLARRAGGINILPPYITAYANPVSTQYNTRLEALKGVLHSITTLHEDYVILCDCGIIANLDFGGMLRAHEESGADITVAVKRVFLTPLSARQNEIIVSDSDNRVTDVIISGESLSGWHTVSMNIWIMRRSFLCSVLMNAVSRNYVSFSRDILQRNVNRMRIYSYDCREEVYFLRSFSDYYRISMDLLGHPSCRNALFSVPGRPVYTKVRNSPPTVYPEGASVSNSLIADGCTVCGRVENSILFRGVRIGRGSVVRNAVLFGDTVVGEGVSLNCVVADKNASVRGGRELCGCQSRPYYIEKGMMI